MSILDRIVKVDISLNYSHEVKWLVVVGKDHQVFIDAIENIGGAEYLEENKIFAVFFDTTPPDKIATEMQDYNIVSEKYSQSFRMLSQAFYVGNVAEQDRQDYIRQCLKCWSDAPTAIWSNVKLPDTV